MQKIDESTCNNTTENSEQIKWGWGHNARVWGGGSTDLTFREVFLFSWFYALKTEESNSMLTPRCELQTIAWCCHRTSCLFRVLCTLQQRSSISWWPVPQAIHQGQSLHRVRNLASILTPLTSSFHVVGAVTLLQALHFRQTHTYEVQKTEST